MTVTTSPPPKDTQGKRWCFTFYDADDLRILREHPHTALCVAKEEGTEEKREHFQGYVKFETNKRFSWWKRVFHTPARCSAHFELANGPEWKCRRYIVDVAAYLRDQPGAHPKTQGEILHDYGCEALVDEISRPEVRVIKMLVDGAALSQIFRACPVFFFHNGRKITDLQQHIQVWRESGEDFRPIAYEPPRKRIKAEASEPSGNE